MKFVVSSTALLEHLQAINRVISSKSPYPILDNFLFQIEGNTITVTASDTETTLITSLSLENVEGSGSIAIPARLLTDTLKEFPEQPLTFEINAETYGIDIISENGKFSIVGQPGEDYPEVPKLREEEAISFKIEPQVLNTGIAKTVFATAEDEMRPVMSGIFIKLGTENLTFVATDAHKLIRYRRTDVKSDTESSFILPKKPATLLKAILGKEDQTVMVSFDSKNAVFQLTRYKMICRLVEGQYPNYESVIPMDNPISVSIDRVEFYNSSKRVSVFSNQASNLVKLKFSGNQLTVSAQDIDFSISAYERINCSHEGDEIEIGFKSAFLNEILANLPTPEVSLQMSEPSRAGILTPIDPDDPNEDILMLIMPMMVNS